MSHQQTGARRDRSEPRGTFRIELIVLPVSDVDRSKEFYEQLGWSCDIDHYAKTGLRIVQFTPPGSQTSIMFGQKISEATPGSVQGLHLVVPDVVAARDELLGRNVAVGLVFHDQGGVFHRAGREFEVSGPNPDLKSYASYASFSDPDGNGWVLQEVRARLGPDLQVDDPRFTPELSAAALAYMTRDTSERRGHKVETVGSDPPRNPAAADQR